MQLLGTHRTQRRHVQEPFQERVTAPVPLARRILRPYPPGATDDVGVGEAVQLGVGGEAEQVGSLLQVRDSRTARGIDRRPRHVRHHAPEPVPVDQRTVAQPQGPGALVVVEDVRALSPEPEQISGVLQQVLPRPGRPRAGHPRQTAGG